MAFKRAKSVFFAQSDGGTRVDEKPISRRTSLVETDHRYEAWVDEGHVVLIIDKQRPNEPPVRVPWHRVCDYQLVGDVFVRPEASEKPVKSLKSVVA